MIINQNKFSLPFILFLICFSTNSFAQIEGIPGAIRWGEELKEPNNTFLNRVIGSDVSGFYAIREKQPKGDHERATSIYVEHYTPDMDLRKAREIDLEYNGKELEYEHAQFFGNRLYLFSSFYNAGKKMNFLFAQEVDRRSLRPKGKLQKVADTPTRNRYKDGFFDYHISRDSSRMVIFSSTPVRKNNPEAFSFWVYDQDMNSIWDKKVVLPYGNRQFDLEEYQVDKDGNVYVLGIVNSEKNRRQKRGKPTYRYAIFAYRNNGFDVQEYKIDLGDRFITDLTFRVANDGNLVCSGFYSDRDAYSVKGTYFFHLNTDSGLMEKTSTKAFDREVLISDMSDREIRRAERRGEEAELYEYSLDHLILRSDGGAVLIAEQVFIQVQQWDNGAWGGPWGWGGGIYNPNIRTDNYYNYNDLIVVNINPSGEIDWIATIPKRQVTRNDRGYYSSYAMSIVLDKIYFVYNENGKNFNRERNDRWHSFNGSNSVIALTEVDNNGNVKTYPLATNRDANTITRPKVCRQVGLRQMVIYGEKGRSFRFGNLSFM